MKKSLIKDKSDVRPYTVPLAIQIVAIVCIGVSFAWQSLSLLWSAIQQYTYNSHVGGTYGYLVTTVFLPLALFLIAYAFNPRNLKLVAWTFESIVLTIAGLSVSALILSIQPTWLSSGSDYIEDYATFQIVTSIVLILVYALLLYWLRRSRRWS